MLLAPHNKFQVALIAPAYLTSLHMLLKKEKYSFLTSFS